MRERIIAHFPELLSFELIFSKDQSCSYGHDAVR